MARFYGIVGYASDVETSPGVWERTITERYLKGSVLQDARRLVNLDQINTSLDLGHVFSLVADEYAVNHMHEMVYLVRGGVKWAVSSVEYARPRLKIRISGRYR